MTDDHNGRALERQGVLAAQAGRVGREHGEGPAEVLQLEGAIHATNIRTAYPRKCTDPKIWWRSGCLALDLRQLRDML